MNIYEPLEIEAQLNVIAKDNEGEIPEEMLQALIEKQAESLIQIEKLCKYIRHLELGIDSCKAEENRIAEMRKKAENRIASIKKYMTPYIQKSGKITAGTFTLSTRKSESVIVDDWFFSYEENQEYCTVKIQTTPDKKKIKEAIKKGLKIEGASIKANENLQIK